MSQVVRTTNELIVDSLRFLGELGVNETADSYMLTSGLSIINELLDTYSANGICIPYLTTHTFPFVPNQAIYTVSDILLGATIEANRIIDLVFANMQIDTVHYPIDVINKTEFYRNNYLDTNVSRPSCVFLNKQPTFSELRFYPAPAQAYNCTIQVKSMLNMVEQHSELTFLPPYYYGFLKYALAREFRNYYPSNNWTDTAEQRYQELYNNMRFGNELNFTITPSILLDVREPYNWTTLQVY